ncbi:unnamed protein product [Prunus armeniaca]
MAATKRPEDVASVDVYTAKGLLSVGHRYLDVRLILKLRDRCHSGGRSLKACVDILNEGFQHVTNMEGGYSAWVDSGLAHDKPTEDLKVACKFRP